MISMLSVPHSPADQVHQSQFLGRTAAADVDCDVPDSPELQAALPGMYCGHLQSGRLLQAVEQQLLVAPRAGTVTVNLRDHLGDSVRYFVSCELI